MEDILASIRRIIASDQTIGTGRGFAPHRLESPAAADRTLVEASVSAGTESQASLADGEEPQLEHPGAIPGLHDLDALVLPPRPLNDDTGPGHLNDEARHGTSSLHEQLFPPSEPRSEDVHVFNLRSADRVTDAPEQLISSSAGAAISSSFKALTDTMLMRDPEMIERVARETLRPMLKTWLDENLPSMVERLVRAEIERVARGGRSRD